MTGKILIVDDLPANLRILEGKLQSKYYEVFKASNAIDAIKTAKEIVPDVILLDYMMPTMNGIEACKILKSDKSTTFIPIVIITALNDDKVRLKGLEAGADDFLSKPINDFALFARLKSLVRFRDLIDELLTRFKAERDFNLENVELELMHYADDMHDAKILVAHSDEYILSEILETLSAQHFRVVTCNTPENVPERMVTESFDLLILGLDSQDFNGKTIAAKVRNNKPSKHSMILGLLEEDFAFASDIYESGVNDYLTLPWDAVELLARVKLQIKRKRYQDALRDKLDCEMIFSYKDPFIPFCYNKNYFFRYLSHLLAKSHERQIKSFAIMMIDVDKFKSVNDTYGHQVGDEVLLSVAQEIQKNIRMNDFLTRFGGDEFIVIAQVSSLSSASAIGERISKSVYSIAFKGPDGQVFHCSISLGILQYCSSKKFDGLESKEAELIIGKADELLYDAKHSGGNALKAASYCVDDI